MLNNVPSLQNNPTPLPPHAMDAPIPPAHPKNGSITVGDCIEVMRSWPDNFVDTIITDPPYGIGFMGKAWDSFDPAFNRSQVEKSKYDQAKEKLSIRRSPLKGYAPPSQHAGLYDQSLQGHREFQAWCCAWATEALRIAKPGAFMLVSGGTRTFHRMTAGLEDAGWEIRDCLMWLYGSGFPKSHNLHGEFEGWGTALKPAWEPIIVAMKPLDGTFAENAQRWGVAGINVDGGRIANVGDRRSPLGADGKVHRTTGNAYGEHQQSEGFDLSKGRWPANLLLDEEAAAMLDGQSGDMRARGNITAKDHGTDYAASSYQFGGRESGFSGDSGGASRFFYVAKSSRAERNEGCDGLPEREKKTLNDYVRPSEGRTASKSGAPASNHHPTVKPLKLMEYLCTLTKTPTGGIVLDPFTGSGSTLIAAERTGRPWLGIEMNPEYVAIANARLGAEQKQLKMEVPNED